MKAESDPWAITVSVLNTGKMWDVRGDSFSNQHLDGFRHLATGGGNLPAPVEQYSIVEMRHFDTGVFFMLKREEPELIAVVLAWGQSDANWRVLEDIYFRASERRPEDFAACEEPEHPQKLPWLAILRSTFGMVLPIGVLRYMEEIVLPAFCFMLMEEQLKNNPSAVE